MAQLIDLDADECLDRLQRGVIGRVALSTPEGPHIVPVTYQVADGGVLVATSAYSVLGTTARGQVVAFEVDGFDPGRRTGWSVVVRGRAEQVDLWGPGRVDPSALPRAWAGGVRSLVLRIPWTELSGRRLAAGVISR